MAPDDYDARSRAAHEPANLTAPHAAPLLDRPPVGGEGAGGGAPPAQLGTASTAAPPQLGGEVAVGQQPAYAGRDLVLLGRVEQQRRVAHDLGQRRAIRARDRDAATHRLEDR